MFPSIHHTMYTSQVASFLCYATCVLKVLHCLWPCLARQVWLSWNCPTALLSWLYMCIGAALSVRETHPPAHHLWVRIWSTSGRGEKKVSTGWGVGPPTPGLCGRPPEPTRHAAVQVTWHVQAAGAPHHPLISGHVAVQHPVSAAFNIHVKALYSIHGRICALYRVRMLWALRLPAILWRAKTRCEVCWVMAATWWLKCRQRSTAVLTGCPDNSRRQRVYSHQHMLPLLLAAGGDRRCRCSTGLGPALNPVEPRLEWGKASMTACWSPPGGSFPRGNLETALAGHPGCPWNEASRQSSHARPCQRLQQYPGLSRGYPDPRLGHPASPWRGGGLR